MIQRWLMLPLLLPSCLAQYAAHPDLTFNDNNDRFDVGNIIAAQNRLFHDQPTEMDLDGRRLFDDDDNNDMVEYLRNDRQQYETVQRGKSVRRILAEQADRDNYARNLAAFQRQNLRRYLERRTSRESLDIQNPGVTLDKQISELKANVDKEPFVIKDLGIILDNESPIANLDSEPVRNLDKIIESSRSEDGNQQQNEEYKYTEEESMLAKLVREAVLKHLQQGKGFKIDARRSATNPDNDLLLQYAVPINLKVNGYLELPQNA